MGAARGCRPQHVCTAGTEALENLSAQGTAGLGENLYQVSGPAGSLPPQNQVIADAVGYWYAEIQSYNYANPGATPMSSSQQSGVHM